MSDPLTDRLKEIEGGKILDVATGKGVFLKEIIDAMKSFDSAVGIDMSEKHIADARKEHEAENIKFDVMDAYHLDFDNDSFDTVTIANSLHHFNDPGQVVREMYRVMKPGGLFLIYEMVNDNQTEEQQTHVEMHHWWAEIDTAEGIVHNATCSRNELLELVEPLGLERRETIAQDDPESDAHDKKTVDWLHEICDGYIERAEKKPELTALVERGIQLKRRLNDIGIRWATEFCILGRK